MNFTNIDYGYSAKERKKFKGTQPPDYAKPQHYQANEGLIAAANTALLLARPLLVTGEPGTGKTHFANSLSHRLFGQPCLKFETKSTSTARDLFYLYDSLRHFHALHAQEIDEDIVSALNYVKFQALGQAILEGQKKSPDWLTPYFLFSSEDERLNLSDSDSSLSEEIRNFFKEKGYPLGENTSLSCEEGEWILDDVDKKTRYRIRKTSLYKIYQDFVYAYNCQRVVLIDEIDKAPRDFPNDILNEIEDMYFKIPELGNVRAICEENRPLVVFTSNSEQHLPDAFLRRCVYYDLPFPEKKEINKIIKDRMNYDEKDSDHTELVQQELKSKWEKAIDFFYELREDSIGLYKKPTTSELLNWLTVLNRYIGICKKNKSEIKLDKVLIKSTLCTLVKNKDDQCEAEKVMETFDW